MPDAFYVQSQGQRDRPALLFLHGFLGDGTDFQTVIDSLSKEFFCLSVDLPGHGKTSYPGDGPDSYAMPPIATALIQWLQSRNIIPINLVGYSMGGRLALYLALNYPQLFPRAIIESASPGLSTASARNQRIQQDEQLAQSITLDYPKFLKEWYAQPLFQSLQQHPQFEDIVQRRSHNQPTALAQVLRGMSTGRQPSLWADLSKHRQPLLLIVGAGDRKFIPINQAMAARCPTAQLICIPQAGHNVHLENPRAFSQAVGDFLRG